MTEPDNKLANLAAARLPEKLVVSILAGAFLVGLYLLWRSL